MPFTGESEEFSGERTDEELAGLKDDNGDIRFSKVMEFCLPWFNQDVPDNGAFGPERSHIGLWESQANRMENYMMYLIDYHGLKSQVLLSS